uniref:Uncharacterized protein n=1 Tax=Arundo donax TaxID=35708 RepID=A0A0A9HB05_ARUDO
MAASASSLLASPRFSCHIAGSSTLVPRYAPAVRIHSWRRFAAPPLRGLPRPDAASTAASTSPERAAREGLAVPAVAGCAAPGASSIR